MPVGVGRDQAVQPEQSHEIPPPRAVREPLALVLRIPHIGSRSTRQAQTSRSSGASSRSTSRRWETPRPPPATARNHGNQDPGPRACQLDHYPQLKATGVAPAQWKFDASDWWLEEHGLIMEKPTFPLTPGKYLVTGDRDVTTVLTVHPKGSVGLESSVQLVVESSGEDEFRRSRMG